MDRKITTRAAAVVAGEPRYFTGEPCKHGHIAERHTLSGACLECAKASRERETEVYRAAQQSKA